MILFKVISYYNILQSLLIDSHGVLPNKYLTKTQ